MEMASVRNDLGQVDTHGEDLYAALVKLRAQFFQSTQLADTVGSPVCSEEFYEYQMPIE